MQHEEFRYLPVNRRDRQWGLYVTGAGVVLDGQPDADLTCHPEPYFYRWEDGRRFVDEFQLVYHPYNSLEMESEETGSVVVPAGNLVVLCAGMWHRYRPVLEPNWTQYWVSFGGGYVEQLARKGVFSPKEPLHHIGPDAGLLASYRRLFDRLQASSPVGLQQLLAASAMEILGLGLATARARTDGELDESLVCQAKSVMEQGVEEPLDMQELAASLGIGYHPFRRMFKQVTGLAPYQYHLQLRIGRAKQMLSQTDLSVKDIACSLKFNDSYHFSKIFKQHTGVSPTEWRDGTRGRREEGLREIRTFCRNRG